MQIKSCSKSAIYLYFIFNIPDLKCLIILQCIPGNTPNRGQLNTAYLLLLVLLLNFFWGKILYQHRSTTLTLLRAYCLFQKSASTSAEAVESATPFIHTNWLAGRMCSVTMEKRLFVHEKCPRYEQQ
jgi:hypothetical protein